jgi:endo-1,4-beta-xylanase
MGLRCHVATWYHNLPSWAPEAFSQPGGKAVLDRHVAEVVEHFRGRASQWDVVNEAVAPENGRPDGLRNNILLKTFGPAHIRDSFLIAREADPGAMLFYNDAALEYDTPVQAARRRATLRLLETLVKSQAPVQALGIQGHLEARSHPFSAKEFRAFIKDVAALGLKILITEFDVSDRFVDGDFDVRDQAVADAGKEFLDVAFDEPAMMGVVAWGLSDRYTWLNGKHRWARTDGKPNRALPLDAAMNRKPLWHAIGSAFDHAPARG